LEEVFDLLTRHLAMRREHGINPKDVPDIMADEGVAEMRNARSLLHIEHTAHR
jgi:hypothetical protein